VADPQDSISNGHAEALLDPPTPDVDDELDDGIEELDDDADAVALEDDLDLDLDLDRVSPVELGGEGDDLVPAGNAATPGDAELVARVQRLEEAAQALADAEVSRDGRRVKRKVKAATGGAGFAALIPFVLQIAGAYNLSPELVSGITAAVALVGAFAAGWTTPERKPSLPSSAVQSLLDGART
jgi:hypothetical protein